MKILFCPEKYNVKKPHETRPSILSSPPEKDGSQNKTLKQNIFPHFKRKKNPEFDSM